MQRSPRVADKQRGLSHFLSFVSFQLQCLLYARVFLFLSKERVQRIFAYFLIEFLKVASYERKTTQLPLFFPLKQ